MARTRIKICGVRDPDTAHAAVDAGADAIGLVFVEGTPRHVSDLEHAARIIDALPAFVEPVGLFVNAAAQDIRLKSATLGLRTIQLHGGETPDFARALAPLRVIRAFPFSEGDLPQRLQPWRNCPNLAAILVDAPPPSDPGTPPGQTGGHGDTFDWNALASQLQAGLLDDLPPLVLAGGLTPDNVDQAIRLLQPFAVDVSSGVESSRGVKDHQRIRDFCLAAQRA